MTAAKPIDWTRPLRMTGGGMHPARVTGINPDSKTPVSLHVQATGWRGDVDRDGVLAGIQMVENAPTPPVERWLLLTVSDGGPYEIHSEMLLKRPDFELGKNERIAKVLIEEPGE